MNISGLIRIPGVNTDSFRLHRPADVGLPGALIFLLAYGFLTTINAGEGFLISCGSVPSTGP